MRLSMLLAGTAQTVDPMNTLRAWRAWSNSEGAMRISRAIDRRIRRLELAISSRDDVELVELELSDEPKALLRESLT